MKINKTLTEKMLSIITNVVRKAKAEEGDTPTQPDGGEPNSASTIPPATPAQPSIDFESLISKARKEEKEKLYPEITKLKEELDKKVTRINELLLAIGEKDEIISQKDKELKEAKADSKKSESQEVKELNLKITGLENKLAEKEGEISNIKLDSYKASKMAEAKGEIIPELVTGSSEEEIDLAVERAKERYKEIVSKIAVPPAKTQNSNSIPPVNPNTQSFDNSQVNVADLSSINLYTPEGKAEYARMRAQMGLK